MTLVRPGRGQAFILLAVVLAISLLAACGGAGGSDKLVVYVSETAGNPDVYTVDVESGETERLASGPDSQFSPAWSPDRDRIAYVVQQAPPARTSGGDASVGGNRDVFVMRVDGRGPEVRISPEDGSSGGNQGSPRWNSEADRLAYVSEADGQADVFVAGFMEDETEQVLTSRVTTSETGEMLGDWSPDGQWLVFSREGGRDTQGLWIRNPDGVNQVRLTEGADSDPVWSSDGDVIAFVRDDLGNSDIYLVKPENGEEWRGEIIEERWLHSDQEEHSPAWAPDGDTLAFVTTRDGNAEIYTANVNEDAQPLRLTINESADTEPVWSPDGDRIAFVSDLFGETEILVMDSDGTNQRRLTNNEVRDHSPDW